MVSNQRYYAQRAAQESMRAQRALCPDARAWHQQLADNYRQRATGGIEAQV